MEPETQAEHRKSRAASAATHQKLKQDEKHNQK